MKALLTIALIFATTFAWAGDDSAPTSHVATVIKGEVLEVKEVESYTYLRLKTKDGEIWAAVTKASVKEGAEVMIENAMVMNDFESKSLQQNFPVIVFGSLAGTGGGGKPDGGAAPMGHPPLSKAPESGDIQVPKASGENAYTVAEIIGKAGELKDKTVLVSGKVVKYNPRIMGKNWVHLRDGSGSAAEQTNDLLVTTTNEVKLGDVVTASGTVRTDKDFGAGYVYKVLVEEATFQP